MLQSTARIHYKFYYLHKAKNKENRGDLSGGTLFYFKIFQFKTTRYILPQKNRECELISHYPI